MRPNKLRRLLALTASGAVLAGTCTGWVARADTVSMRGVMGFQPDYANLGLCPCKPLSHPVMPWSVGTIADRIEQWASTPDSVNPASPKVALTYSLSTVGALEYLDEPGAKPVQVWAFGSPETPKRESRDKAVPESEDRSTVTFVVALYDPIADPIKRWNLYAAINSRLSTHLTAYDDLDLSNPSATYTAPDGSTTLYYAPDVLPMLKWREKWTTPERMAELDAKYRPRIEAAYDRPVHVPAPSEPEPELAEEETDAAQAPASHEDSGEVLSDEPEGAETSRRVGGETRQQDLGGEPAEVDLSEPVEDEAEPETGPTDSVDDDQDAEPSDSDTSDAPSGDSDDNEGGDE